MAVVGVAQVEAARGKVLRLRPGDVVTPLARDRAKELGVSLESDERAVRAPAPAEPPRMRPDVLDAQQPSDPSDGGSSALYRRGAPVASKHQAFAARSSLAQPGADRPDLRPKVAVVGAGHVGATTALFLAEADVFSEVVLVDVVPGRAAGIALDLWHSAALKGFTTRLSGDVDLQAVAGASYVVVTAGKPRQPGMSRTDLTQVNAAIVAPLAEQIARYAAHAVIVVVTNPLEEMTYLACRASKFRPQRVIGMAGVLDSARFCSLLALTGVTQPERVEAVALGSHGPEMVIPLSQARADGRVLEEVVQPSVLQAVVERARDSGAEVVKLLQTGSAYFAPAASTAAMVLAMQQDVGAVMPACVEPAGQYGLRGVRIGLPAKLGRSGVTEIINLPLRPEELAALRSAASRIDERIAALS